MVNNLPSLTKKQRIVYEEMKKFWNKHGYSPSVSELTRAMGRKSEAGVFSIINKLEEKGYLEASNKSKRALLIQGTLPYARQYVICVPILSLKQGTKFLSQESISGYYPIPKEYQKYNPCFVVMEGTYINHTDKRGILICQEPNNYIEKTSQYWMLYYLNQLHLIKTHGDTAMINGEKICIRPYVVAKIRGVIERI